MAEKFENGNVEKRGVGSLAIAFSFFDSLE